jgi:hypothetical protein
VPQLYDGTGRQEEGIFGDRCDPVAECRRHAVNRKDVVDGYDRAFSFQAHAGLRIANSKSESNAICLALERSSEGRRAIGPERSVLGGVVD